MIGRGISLFSKVLLSVNFLLLACTGSDYTNVDQGTELNYNPGAPLFSFGAYSILIDDQIPGLEIHAALFRRSLIFQQSLEGVYIANIIYGIEITPFGSETPTYNREFSAEILSTSYKDSKSGKVERLKKTLPLPPGDYQIKFRIIDGRSKQVSVSQNDVSIPNPESDPITSIILTGNDEKKRDLALVNYQVPAGIDSMKIRTFAQTGVGGVTDISLRLLSFPSDSLPATPPHYFNPLEGSLERMGINYSAGDTVYASNRNLSGLFGGVGIEFQLPRLDKGVYRILLTSYSDTVLVSQKIRDFAVTEKQFPLIATSKTLADATIYLTERSNNINGRFHELSSDSVKKYLDVFWSQFGENTYRAKSILSGYYSRVEEANLMFSTYKEGWKTDPGMIYILFGPPSSMERTPGGMSWYYPTRQSEYPLVFYFDRMVNSEGPLPGSNYVLKRHFQYERWYSDQIWKWKMGGF